MPTKQLTRQEVEAMVERLADKSYLYSKDIAPNLYSLNEIFIGDILEKMKIQGNSFRLKSQSNEVTQQPLDRFIFLWDRCGVAKSLQEIASESGWEEIWECGCVGSHLKNGARGIPLKHISQKHPSKKMEVLTSPEANALFSFLQEIL